MHPPIRMALEHHPTATSRFGPEIGRVTHSPSTAPRPPNPPPPPTSGFGPESGGVTHPPPPAPGAGIRRLPRMRARWGAPVKRPPPHPASAVRLLLERPGHEASAVPGGNPLRRPA